MKFTINPNIKFQFGACIFNTYAILKSWLFNLFLGAVKITPAHDKTDHDIGRRHGLPSMSVISRSGLMENVGAPYLGMKRFDARKEVLGDLKRRNLYRGSKSHPMTLPICRQVLYSYNSTRGIYRCKIMRSTPCRF